MQIFLRSVYAWILAAVVTACLASAFSTQMVASKLVDAGGVVSGGERLAMTVYDIQHFAALYGIFVLVAFLIAFLAAAVIAKRSALNAKALYIGAGFIGMLVMLYAMKQVFFGVPILAGARSVFGLGLQGLAGAVGGYVFWRVLGHAKNSA